MFEIADKAIAFIPRGEIEEPALRQIELLATMPFIHRHVAVMPDCHLGRGATVGSMIPTLGAIIPAAVGVDIGCGMIAARTELTAADLPEDLSGIRQGIERRIPLAAGASNRGVTETAQPRVEALEEMAGDRLPFYDKTKRDWRKQIGSLGSGNPLHRGRSGQGRARLGLPALRFARRGRERGESPYQDSASRNGTRRR